MTYRLMDIEEIEKSLSWLSEYWGKPTHSEYYNARTVNEAVSLLDEYKEEAKIIAGGIDLIGLMKNKVLSPRVLINIKTIPDMKYVIENATGLSIGALTLINDIERSTLIRSKYPILFEAAGSIASPQIRNMATIGGNLCQDVRCWYYRRSPATGISFNCRQKIDDGICYAIDGENQYHSIFGENKCCAVCPSDMATVLLASDAKINTVSTSGGRIIPIDKFYTTFGNILEPNEIITAIQVTEIASGAKQRFLKFRLRKAIDFAIVSVATVITLNDNVVSQARIVIGGVSSKPYRAVKAEGILTGEPITERIAEKVAELSVKDAMPLSKNAYKVPVVKTLVKRALLG